ncbi:MAG: vWA domain-containing protein, partial [Acidimicrobiales bacterium]
MVDLLGGFVAELRAAGLPVSLTESIDAAQAVTHIPVEDREAFKYALGATLVKSHAHWKAFETVFEVYFSERRGDLLGPGDGALDGDGDGDGEGRGRDGAGRPGRQGASGGGAGEPVSPEELAEMLYQALLRDDRDLVSALARIAVTLFAGMEPGRPVGGTYYLYRTLRRLDLDGLLARLMEAARAAAVGAA